MGGQLWWAGKGGLGRKSQGGGAEGLAEGLRPARPRDQGLVQGQGWGSLVPQGTWERGWSRGCELNNQGQKGLEGDVLVMGGDKESWEGASIRVPNTKAGPHTWHTGRCPELCSQPQPSP